MPCPDGKGARVKGMKNDALCRDGCVPGNFSADGFNTEDDRCKPCPGGKYQAGFRGTTCHDCLAGTFSVAGASRCTLCPPGHFNQEDRATSCESCDHGTYAESAGTTVCSACQVTASTLLTGSDKRENCAVMTYREYAFGSNLWGQLGVDSVSEYESQARLFANDIGNTMTKLGNEKVTHIAGGYSHTLVLTRSLSGYSVWCMGSNDHGELGPSGQMPPVCLHPDSADNVCTETPSYNPNPVSIPPHKLDNLVPNMVFAGRHSSYALAEGRIFSWGYSRYGQLGRPVGSSLMVPPRYFGFEKITALAVGWYHVLALDEDQRLWAWGSNR
jgi:hypothetical protein